MAKLTYEELVTAVTNFRPLSYVSSDVMDEPLTLAHLLAGRRLLSLSDSRIGKVEFDVHVSEDNISKRMCFIITNF